MVSDEEIIIYPHTFRDIVPTGSERAKRNVTKGVGVYKKTTCSKCHEVENILKELQIPYEVILYYDNSLSRETIKSILGKLNMRAQDIIRTGESVYKELGLKEKKLSEDELIDLIITYPDLMQRPIIEQGDRAIIGRPPEKIKQFLSI